LLPYPGLTAWANSSPSFVGLIGLAALAIRTIKSAKLLPDSNKNFYRTAINFCFSVDTGFYQ
ncbi:MAG: hypothetical protein ACI3YC_03930, partial [Alloprevotella sp.]